MSNSNMQKALDILKSINKVQVEKIPGGAAAGKESKDYDSDQLKIGTQHELEHGKDQKLAQEIAMDHLEDDPNYYRKLEKFDKAQPGEELDEFRGGDPEIAQEKKEEKREEQELEKAGAGEEAGEFRGGDPELAQQKKEEKREEAAGAGEVDEPAEEMDQDEADELIAEEAEKEEEKSVKKAMPLTSSQVSPVDTLEDYRPRDINGDPLDKKPEYAMPDIKISPTRRGANQFRPWSEVTGIKIPLTGNPWIHMKRWLMRGDDKRAIEENDKLSRCIDESFYEYLTDFAKAGVEKLLILNHGLMFDPYCFGTLVKAAKWEVIPGHKYIYREWKGDAWRYTYTDGIHNNHGIQHAGNQQGHTVEAHDDWHQQDPEHKDPKGGFEHAQQKVMETGGVFPLTINNPDTPTGEPVPEKFHLVVRPGGQAKPLELHRDEGQDPSKLKPSKADKRMRSFDDLEHHFRKTQHVSTELGPDGTPYLQWYIGKPGKSKTGKETTENRPYVRFIESSPHYQEYGFQTSKSGAGWFRPFRSIEGIKNHLQKVAEQHTQLSQDKVSTRDIKPAEKGKTWAETIESGAFSGAKKKVDIAYKNTEDPKKGGKRRGVMRVDWESGAEQQRVTGGIRREFEGMSVKIANDLVREANKKRMEQGKMPITGKSKGRMIGNLISTPAVIAVNRALDGYTPGKAKFSSYLYSHMQGEMLNEMRAASGGEIERHTAATDTSDLFNSGKSSEGSRVPKARMSAHNAAIDASDKTPQIEHEDLREWANRAEEHMYNHYMAALESDTEDAAEIDIKMAQVQDELEGAVKSGDYTKVLSLINNHTDPKHGGIQNFLPPLEIKNRAELHSQMDDAVKRGEVEQALKQEYGDGRLGETLSDIDNSIPEEERDEGVFFSPSMKKRIKNEGLQTFKDLAVSIQRDPSISLGEKAKFNSIAEWVKRDSTLSAKHGPVPRSEELEKALDILKANLPIPPQTLDQDSGKKDEGVNPLGRTEQEEQPNNSPPDVQYIGKRGEPEAPQFLYETSGVKNIVYGTNAPKDSRDYDEVLGDPVFDPHEPHPETQPEFFDEQGRKLSGPVPEDVEVEDNPEYDEDRTKGNFWVKRYTDPQTGEPVYIYLHRDQILDPRLKNNIEIKYLDEQLPKIRAWYQEKMMSADPHDRAVALLTALVDQAKFRIREVLLGLRVKDVTVHDHTKITVRLPHGGSTDVTMDRTPMNVLREIMSGKKEDDLIFEVNGDKFDYETFARFMKDNFGVLPSFFHTYHVTELFSKEFHKLVRKDTEELSSDRMDELKQEALKKVADVLHIHDPEFLESHLDPIAMEALYLAAHTTDKKHLSKGSFKLQGRLSFQGLPVSIENKKGSVRKWYDPHGEESGQTKMHFDYGYINGTCGVDGDYVDVYIGPNKESKTVFVVHQMKKPDFKKYDEDKVMLGFDSAKEAKSAYLKQYNDPGFFGALDEIPMNAFKKKVLATAERPCMIKSWHVAVNPPDRDPDETMFSQWVHSYPIHEHYFHWDAYQKKAEDAQFEDIARIGLIGGTKKPPMSGESHAEVSL